MYIKTYSLVSKDRGIFAINEKFFAKFLKIRGAEGGWALDQRISKIRADCEELREGSKTEKYNKRCACMVVFVLFLRRLILRIARKGEISIRHLYDTLTLIFGLFKPIILDKGTKLFYFRVFIIIWRNETLLKKKAVEILHIIAVFIQNVLARPCKDIHCIFLNVRIFHAQN